MTEALGYQFKTGVPKLIECRTVPLNGKINPEMADGICETLIAFDLNEIKPITLLIVSSGGGDVIAGRKIINTINILRSPVDCMVLNRAGSMAVDILLSCRKRLASPEAQFFVHFTRCGFEAIHDSDEITEADIATMKRIMTGQKDEREDLYMKRLKKSRAEIQQLFHLGEKFSYDHSAREALALGMIDGIVTNFKLFEPSPFNK